MSRLPFPLVALGDLDFLGAAWADAVAAAFRGGLPWLCLRGKGATTAERVRWGRAAQARCPGLALTVHGDPEAAATLGARGLHLPARGFDVAALRRQAPGLLLGVSCHGRDELAAAVAAGADYAFLSPFWPPASKPLWGKALGSDGFAREARGCAVPVLALGGVGPDRLVAVAAAGAAGAAVLGALFGGPDPEARARAYRAEAARIWGDSTGDPPG